MTLLEKVLAGLMIWVLVLVAIILTIGAYKFAMNPIGIKVDCTTHNFNPDATSGQRELCRKAK